MNRTVQIYRIVLLTALACLIRGPLGAMAATEEKPVPANSDNRAPANKPAANQAESPDGEVYIIKYADPYNIVNLLKSLFFNNQAMVTIIPENPSASSRSDSDNTSGKTSSIIVHGSPETQKKVAEAIKKLDVPPQAKSSVTMLLNKLDALSPEERQEVKVFRLLHVEPVMAAKVITMLGLTDLRMAPDERTRSIIVYATPKTLDMVEKLLAKLDTDTQQAPATEPRAAGGAAKAKGYEVRVIWLADGLTGEHRGDPPSEDLKDVLAELSRHGIKDPRQVGQMVVRTASGDNFKGKFEVNSFPQFGGAMAGFSASGILLEERPDGALVVQIKISTRPVSAPKDMNLNEVSTQIVLPQKQTIVLATAPVGEQTSIFVIQVTGGVITQPSSGAKDPAAPRPAR
jgi:hypothetical protein